MLLKPSRGSKVPDVATKKSTQRQCWGKRSKMQSDRQIVLNWWEKKKKKKTLMNEFNNKEKPSMWGCRMWKIFLFLVAE